MAIDFLNFNAAGVPATRTQLNTAVPASRRHVVFSLIITNNDPAPQTVVIEKWNGTAFVKLHPGLPLPSLGSFGYPKVALTPGQYIAVTPSKAGVFDFDMSIMEKS